MGQLGFETSAPAAQRGSNKNQSGAGTGKNCAMIQHTHFDPVANARVWCLDPACQDYPRREPRFGLIAFLCLAASIGVVVWWQFGELVLRWWVGLWP